METLPLLTERFAKDIKGTLGCYDRLVFFGTYQTIGWPGAMADLLQCQGVKLIDYTKTHANELRLQMVEHIRNEAAACGVAIHQINATERKEAFVEAILQKRGRKPGLVCILGAMERCSTFKVGKNKTTGFLELQWSPGKCQHFYIYFIHEELGLCYLRIPTWAPFRLQFYCNGHDWLERRMQTEKISFKKRDNCFTHIADFARAQELASQFDPERLHLILNEAARRWVAVHPQLGHSLYWSIYQAEWATDIVFKNDKVLPDLYKEIIQTAAVEVGCQDIYRYLGKRHTGRSKQEASTRINALEQGTRIKHQLGSTSLKMYDKAGSVLRIECTTSDVKSFTHYRMVESRSGGTHNPEEPASEGCLKNAPMRKTIYSLPALQEAMSAVNQRYLAAISQWTDRTRERHDLRRLTSSVKDDKERSHRGVNFFCEEDLAFMQAVQRGEHQIQGLRNRGLREHLPKWSAPKIGRHLRRFRVHGLLKSVAGTHKYYLTKKGNAALTAGKQLIERLVLPALTR